MVFATLAPHVWQITQVSTLWADLAERADRRSLFYLLHILCKFFFKLLLARIAHPFLQNSATCIEQINFRLVDKSQCLLKILSPWIVGIQIGKLDLAEILCFEPMNHGRHRLTGRSGKAEKLDELHSARCQANSGRIGRFEIWSA